MRSGFVFKSLAAAALALAAFAFNGSARADVDIPNGTPTLAHVYDIGHVSDGGLNTVAPGAKYSNVTTFTGFGIVNGGAVADAGNGGALTTTLLADDLNMTSATSVTSTGSMSFSVANLNSTVVSARVRLRFFLPDGPGGAPGTALGGFSFNPIAFATGVSTFFFNPSATFVFPSANVWAGEFFDNIGATTTTAAQLNNLGQGSFNPVDVGTSADKDFLSGTPVDTFLNNNPSGSVRTSPFAGNPVANYGWEVAPGVPEPTSLAIIGLGLAGLGARRRKA